jgi:DNA-binding transcriptional LysR family regulator
MNWDDLRFALAVARARNMAGAARSLGVAHTTVARRVAALEEELGAPLFDRVGGDCSATPACADLVAVATTIEDGVTAFERRLAGRQQELDGDVAIATMEPLAAKLTEHVLAFGRIHPRIRVTLHTTHAAVDLAKREADIALRATAAPDESLVGTKIARLAFAVFGASGKKLEDAPWICFDDSLSATPQGRWERANVASERVVLRTNSRAVFTEAVTSGAGIGVMPCGVALQIENLVALTEPLPELALPLWLLTHSDLQQTPRVRALLDFLRSALEREKPLLEGRASTLAE